MAAPDDLLPGERVDGEPGAAQHWLRVYSELVLYLRHLEASGDAASVGIVRRRRLYERRLAFWEAELSRLRREGG